MKTFIAGMPKAELHMHLEGAMEPSLVRTLAARNNLPVPASLKERTSGYDFHDLTSFLAVYYPNMAVLQTEADFHDLAWSYLTKAHSQNVVHTEMFFDPQAHTSRGVPFPTVVRGYRQALIKAQRELGISASLIMCFLRDMDAGYAMATLMDALPYVSLSKPPVGPAGGMSRDQVAYCRGIHIRPRPDTTFRPFLIPVLTNP